MKAGVSKQDMTFFEPGIGMFGYGLYEHRALSIKSRLFVRSFVVEDEKKNQVIICVCEILSCTIALKEKVLEKLHAQNYEHVNDSNLLITANHTHSAPGGYSHFPFYSFPMGGIHFDVIETYASAIVKSILEAQNQLQPAVLKIKRAVFSPADQVAYNRSVEPYNANEDVVDKISPQEDYLGIDPEMLLLLFEDLNGKIIGSIDWFGVHTTSVGNECFKISSDNKGYAASYLEEEVPGSVMAFAQKPCGDISPNPPEARGPKRIERTFESDFERARKSGRKQFSKAMECIQSELFDLIDGDVNTSHRYIDLPSVQLDGAFQTIPITGKPALGTTFFRGCYDGFGMPESGLFVIKILSNFYMRLQKIKAHFIKEKGVMIERKYLVQSPKNIVLEDDPFRFLGFNRFDRIPFEFDASQREITHQYNNGALQNHPVLPSVLPIQYIQIGSLAILGFPGEITITAGKRLRQTILKELSSSGIKEVIITPYSNAFCGYVTTPEEYCLQYYEGAHTLYGKKTLWAYIQEFLKMVKNQPSDYERPNSYKFPEEVLRRRSYRYNHPKSKKTS